MRVILTIGITLFLAATLSSRVSATDFIGFDHAWWDALNVDEQVTVVQGLMAGFEAGFNDGAIHGGNYVMVQHGIANTSANAKDLLSQASVSFSETFGHYKDAIDNFYVNHPSASTIYVGEIMACLADTPVFTCDQVAGWASHNR